MDCQKISYLNQPLSWIISSHQTNLASKPDHDHAKLIRENDQTLVPGPSNATHRSPSCIKNPSHCSKAQAKNGGDTNTSKRARFQAVDSVLGDKHHNNMNSHLNNSLNNSHKDYKHPESFPDFDMYLEQNKCYTKHLTDSQIVPELEYKNLKPGHASGNSQPQQSSLQPCQASARSRGNLNHSLVSAGELPNSKFRKQDSGPDKKLGTLNFAHFIRPAALLKANKRLVTGSSNPVELPILPAGCPNIFNQPDSVATTVKLIKPIAKRPRLAVPDEHSEAVGQKHAFFKYNRSPGQVHDQTLGFEAKADKGKPYIWPPVASSSVSSWGDSNNSTYTLKRRRCYDNEESAYQSENVEEEPKSMKNAVPVRVSTRAKRSRTAEVHNLSEKRRREKINKKMRALREIIPNCNKVNNVSLLDEAIEYLKTLQLQVQMMSMRTSLCMPPTILPCGMQQINAPHFAHFSPMGVGCNPAQFLASPISVATALPGITGTRFQMPGIPGQGLTMLWSHAPFIPMQGGPSTQSILIHSLSSATTSVEHLSSTPLSIEFKRFNTEHQLRS